MKRFWKHIIIIAVSFLSRGIIADTTPAGIYVKNGVTMLAGEPYRAMGMNYQNCFARVLADAENREFEEGFRILKEEYHIPFIRFMAGPYSHQGWRFYLDDPDEYFRRLDMVLKKAEDVKLGLIPSLFWFVVSVPDLMNEPLSELGNKNSRSREFIRKYTTDFVTRYKNSPAIYGWELGNEYLLAADLPQLNHLPQKKAGSDQPRTAADKLFRPVLYDLYQEFYQTVRAIDPHRIIVTGDSIARAHAWHNRNQDAWGQDSRDQWLRQFRADTPECYETVSFHLYDEADEKYFSGENLTIEKFVEAVVKDCRRNNKAVWCGELGMPGYDKNAEKMFFRMLNSVEKNGIDISAIWNFIPSGKYQGDWDILPSGERSYMLEAVKKLNERFAIGQWK